ncbi:MAG TPA: hypothetical protein VH519_02305 [Hyphomicrobiaceae bacterium]|jgi:hypothetical protein
MILDSYDTADHSGWGKGGSCGERLAPRDGAREPSLDARGPVADAWRARWLRVAA